MSAAHHRGVGDASPVASRFYDEHLRGGSLQSTRRTKFAVFHAVARSSWRARWGLMSSVELSGCWSSRRPTPPRAWTRWPSGGTTRSAYGESTPARDAGNPTPSRFRATSAYRAAVRRAGDGGEGVVPPSKSALVDADRTSSRHSRGDPLPLMAGRPHRGRPRLRARLRRPHALRHERRLSDGLGLQRERVHEALGAAHPGALGVRRPVPGRTHALRVRAARVGAPALRGRHRRLLALGRRGGVHGGGVQGRRAL